MNSEGDTCSFASCYETSAKGKDTEKNEPIASVGVSVFISSWIKYKFVKDKLNKLNTWETFLHLPIYRKPPGASHCSGPQRTGSYCGFGAPEQLDEFMVSAKKRRSLSFCQNWFPQRSKRDLSVLPRVDVGHGRAFKKELRESGTRLNPAVILVVFFKTSFNYILLLSDWSQNMLAGDSCSWCLAAWNDFCPAKGDGRGTLGIRSRRRMHPVALVK